MQSSATRHETHTAMPMHRLLRSLALVLALPLFAALEPALAQAAAKPTVILFVGNSFFHGAFEPVKSYNTGAVIDENASAPTGSPRAEAGNGPYGGIPGIFKKLTDELGLNYEVHSELMSGKPLEYHYANALDVVGQPKWNVVAMHDRSTGPVPTARKGNPDRFTKYADLLEQSVHAANAQAGVYLYETWPRADLTYPATGSYHGESIDVMGKDLHDAYYAEAAHNRSIRGVVPAGDAWLSAIHAGVAAADPAHIDAGKINLWGPDSYHPSIYGAYLNALVVVDEVTGGNPETLGAKEQAAVDLGIDSVTAVKLQHLAHEQVRRAADPR